MNHKILGLLLFSSLCLKADSEINDPVLLLFKNLANRTHIPSLEIREEPHHVLCILRSLALKNREDAHALTASVQGSRQINDTLLVKKMTSELNLTQGTLTLIIPTTPREETFLSKTYVKTTILEEKELLPETE